MKQPAFWAAAKAHARKLIPGRAARWTLLYVPVFTAVLLFATMVLGNMADLQAYVIEVGARSLPLLIGVAITYILASGLGWNLDNEQRAYYQRVLTCTTKPAEEEGLPLGAFCVLAGEMLSILALLYVLLRALLVWQG